MLDLYKHILMSIWLNGAMITLTEWGVTVSTYVALRLANTSLLAGAQWEHLPLPVRIISTIESSREDTVYESKK